MSQYCYVFLDEKYFRFIYVFLVKNIKQKVKTTKISHFLLQTAIFKKSSTSGFS